MRSILQQCLVVGCSESPKHIEPCITSLENYRFWVFGAGLPAGKMMLMEAGGRGDRVIRYGILKGVLADDSTLLNPVYM